MMILVIICPVLIFVATLSEFTTPSYSFYHYPSKLHQHQRYLIDYRTRDLLPFTALLSSLSREKRSKQHQYHGDTNHNENSITNSTKIYKSSNVGIVSIAGIDPDDATKVNNQDSTFYFTHSINIDENQYILTCAGVLDGHGKKGHIVSNYFSTQIPKLFQNNEMLSKSNNTTTDNNNITDIIQNVCIDVFEQSHRNACQDSSIPSSRSGTTCIMSILIEEEKGNGPKILVTANVGDSRAILGYCTPNTVNPLLRNCSVIPLSKETTIQQPQEMKRIESSEGGRIVQGNIFYGPIGIAMTRALGDSIMINAGVIPTPDILLYNIADILKQNNNSSIVVVLGSDGVFDVLSNAHVIELVTACTTGNTQEAAELVGKEAFHKWKDDLPLDVRVDDITCLVLKI